MANKTEVTITNGHRYAVHVAGRRFRPGRPRVTRLTDHQLEAVRGNPWLWIEGEDEPIELEEGQVPVISTGGGWYELADGERIKGKKNLPEGAVVVDEFPEVEDDDVEEDDDNDDEEVDDEEEEESDDDEPSTEDDDGEEEEDS